MQNVTGEEYTIFDDNATTQTDLKTKEMTENSPLFYPTGITQKNFIVTSPGIPVVYEQAKTDGKDVLYILHRIENILRLS